MELGKLSEHGELINFLPWTNIQLQLFQMKETPGLGRSEERTFWCNSENFVIINLPLFELPGKFLQPG